MHRRPHDVVHIVGVVLKRVQRPVVLKESERGGYLRTSACARGERGRASGITEDDTMETERRERQTERREGVSELQTEWRCLSLGACLGAEPN